MSDLIDRQVAIDNAYAVIVDDAVYDVVQVETLEGLPSADAVEVVRCKDCKWHRGQWQCLNTDTYGFGLDDYCSLAERREDG